MRVAVISVLAAAAGVLGGVTRPPRGWNSYDSFNWVIGEAEFRQQAKLVAEKLLPHGYDTVVVDYLWAQSLTGTNHTMRLDDQGRWLPNLDRWPSATGSRGFTDVAAYVHSLGLKFGVHIMRGITDDAVAANLPIHGAGGARTGAIGDATRRCPWYTTMMAVNVSAPGAQAWMDSNYALLASWGVDFVKNDCTFGGNYAPDNIRAVALSMQRAGGDWVYSLSPGKVDPSEVGQAEAILDDVSMYRVAGDDWDRSRDVLSHFTAASLFQGLIAARGREKGLSFPDLDMLPFGRIAAPCGNTKAEWWCRPFHQTNLTAGEQRMQMALWSVARSPLFFGGDMTAIDDATLALLTNADALALNGHSSRNRCVSGCSNTTSPSGPVVWAAQGAPYDGASSPVTRYAVLFNAGSAPAPVSASASSLGVPAAAACSWRDAFSKAAGSLTGRDTLSQVVASHDAALIVLACES